MVSQYPDILIYTTATSSGQNEWGLPVEAVTSHNLAGRYESYNAGNARQFVDDGGETIFATAKYLVKFGQTLPPKAVRCKVRGQDYEIIQVHKGQMNATIYLKEVKI